MRSIKTKITFMTACAVATAMTIATILGVFVIRDIGIESSNQVLLLLCETGAKNLDADLERAEHSAGMVAAYVESDLEGIKGDLNDEQLQRHLDRVNDIFKKMSLKSGGVLTYYYRIDPEISQDAKGFWYVDLNGDGFQEHEVTDITLYDTEDVSQLVWFTVPKATGKPVWLPPYITDNLNARVISYNIPVFHGSQFVGVVGIEVDYSMLADQVDSITLFDNGYAFINDADGNIIYHPRMDVLSMAEEERPRAPEGLLDEDTIIHYNYDNVEKQAVWLTLSNDMRLNVTVPVSEINATWQKWVIGIVVIYVIMLVIFILLIMHFAERITKPLRELTEAAKQVDAGNYDFQLEYDSKDEVGILTHTFTQLVAHLKTYISDLNDRAYVDALTSVRNKAAFDEYFKTLKIQLAESDGVPELAICIFDCNDLKEINDQFGHDKGDIYLQNACALICDVFEHSPVFRLGGDEFTAILLNQDFANREALLRRFDEECAESATIDPAWERMSIARGMAVYDPEIDDSMDNTIRRADRLMYENKWASKSEAEE